ncbi:hypothetical protein GCM10009096_00740 [Parasphingorhabdus litoris]|uniref:DUF2147 domain-containing protein n=1 Tax=Parasphingorhabdus litoris TaxID=394733 RepID=A0ABP3JVK5_9SPHN|nr:hypothetical protein [Parasphingorhabdus litoris]
MNLRKSALIIAAATATLLASPAKASTECSREVYRVWTDHNTGYILVCFTTPGCISVGTSQGTQESRDRFYSQATIALASGLVMRVRYPENGLDCNAISSSTRSDFHGIWLHKP